ncbi:GldG family protein [Dyella acidiphila]|uniref:Gldg family protein n=1 Tax=Dyella acidiphila TaxID=2775866 RepID=A0ABR9GCB1_9GAMM|nr:Gldg family protein [Dyella acidiphila]MBE1161676.1 Gldg family protein [Dyella acidiphila]
MARFVLRRRTILLSALAALIVAYCSLTLVTSRWLEPERFDLTADGLYTLSPGTRQIIDNVHRPLWLTLYFSQHATKDLPTLRSYEQRVAEMLQEMVARSHGRIHLQIVDPVPYSDEEASAEGNGLTAMNGGSNGERIFFGLVGATRPASSDAGPDAGADAAEDSGPKLDDRSLSMPFFDPQREPFLEYDIAKLLYQLSEPHKPRIGVMTDLPVMGDTLHGAPAWAVMQQLQQLFDVQVLDAGKLRQIDKSIQVLLLIHPKNLSTDAQYALDQYVLSGGHLAVFVDPFAESDPAPLAQDSLAGTNNHSSNLPRLFADWGVAYSPDQVVLDRARALPIELAGVNLAHPAMLGLGTQELNRDDVLTASLQRVNVSTAGHFDLLPNATTRLIPLLQSSADAEIVPTQRAIDAISNPSSLMQGYQPQNQNYVIAARLRGPFVSAFPELARRAGHVAQSPANAEVILVADTDLLTDRLWVETQNFLGQPLLNAFANNGDFINNLVDNLSGSSALLSIRGRSSSQRPFTRVEALRHAADRKFLQKEQELKNELADTKQRLSELQPAKGERDTSTSAEQKREIEQFLQRQLAISKELRDLQHQLNAEIDALGMRLKVLNIVVLPVLITILGLLYGWRRTRRNRRQRS